MHDAAVRLKQEVMLTKPSVFTSNRITHRQHVLEFPRALLELLVVVLEPLRVLLNLLRLRLHLGLTRLELALHLRHLVVVPTVRHGSS